MHARSIQTCGVQFSVKLFDVSGRIYRVHYWDCPGAQRYINLTSRYCAGSAGVVFVLTWLERALFKVSKRGLAKWKRTTHFGAFLWATSAKMAATHARFQNRRWVFHLYPNRWFTVVFTNAIDFRPKHLLTGTTWRTLRQVAWQAATVTLSSATFLHSLLKVFPTPWTFITIKERNKARKKMLNDRKFKQALFATATADG